LASSVGARKWAQARGARPAVPAGGLAGGLAGSRLAAGAGAAGARRGDAGEGDCAGDDEGFFVI